MSQEAGGRANFIWETQSWAFSNSDNSAAADPGGRRRDEKSGNKPPESGSNSPTGATAVSAGQKRGLNGPLKKSKDGGEWNEHKGTVAAAGGDSDHEIHIWTERERRKKMRNMFSNLHDLLPQLPAKADKSTIVDEAVNYIKTLQQTLQKLQKQKLERIRGAIFLDESVHVVAQETHGSDRSREAFLADQLGNNWNSAMNSPAAAVSTPRFPDQCFQTWSSPNVVVSVNGDDAHINICTAKKPGLLSTIFYVLEKHKLEVVSAQVSSDYFRCMYMIHAHANGVSDQLPETVAVEEIFKLAVGEMILWISS